MTKTKEKKISTPFGKKILKVYDYEYNSRLAILIYNPDGELWSDLTINLPEFFIADMDEGFINGDLNFINRKGVTMVDALKELGIIKESYGLRSYNMGKYEYVKFDLEKLKEYDPDGVKNFQDKVEEIGTFDLCMGRI